MDRNFVMLELIGGHWKSQGITFSHRSGCVNALALDRNRRQVLCADRRCKAAQNDQEKRRES